MKNLDSWHFCGSSLDQECDHLGQFYLGLAVKKVANCENTKVIMPLLIQILANKSKIKKNLYLKLRLTKDTCNS